MKCMVREIHGERDFESNSLHFLPEKKTKIYNLYQVFKEVALKIKLFQTETVTNVV